MGNSRVIIPPTSLQHCLLLGCQKSSVLDPRFKTLPRGQEPYPVMHKNKTSVKSFVLGELWLKHSLQKDGYDSFLCWSRIQTFQELSLSSDDNHPGKRAFLTSVQKAENHTHVHTQTKSTALEAANTSTSIRRIKRKGNCRNPEGMLPNSAFNYEG